MYKPKLNKDIYAIVDSDGVINYVTFDVFWRIQQSEKLTRVDLAWRDNALIDDQDCSIIKQFDENSTKAEVCRAIDESLWGNLNNDGILELYNRLPKVLSVNLLVI